MAKYLIYACELQYNGLHGIMDWRICECTSYDEACEIGYQMSYDVITSYDFIEEALENEVRERLYEEGITEDHLDFDNLYDEWLDDIIEENICYQIYRIRDDVDYDILIEGDTDWTEIRDFYSIKGDLK